MVGSLSDAFTTILVLASAPAEPPSPAEMRGKLSVGIVGCHCGSEKDATAELEPIRNLNPAVDLFDVMPYLQGLFDEEFSPGKRYYFKGGSYRHFRTRPSRRCWSTCGRAHRR